jgi:hypothetical protein
MLIITLRWACRSRQPSCLRHELSSFARTPGPWVPIPLRAWMFSVCVVCAFLCLCTGRGLVTSWSPVQGVQPTVLDLVTEVKRKVSWRRPRSELGCRARGGGEDEHNFRSIHFEKDKIYSLCGKDISFPLIRVVLYFLQPCSRNRFSARRRHERKCIVQSTFVGPGRRYDLFKYIAACRPVARQRPWNKQLYNSHF